jgi:hypothetical protein
MFTCIWQLTLRSHTGDINQVDSGLLLIYISLTISLHIGLLARVPSWTAYQRVAAAREEKARLEKEAGINGLITTTNGGGHTNGIVKSSSHRFPKSSSATAMTVPFIPPPIIEAGAGASRRSDDIV